MYHVGTHPTQGVHPVGSSLLDSFSPHQTKLTVIEAPQDRDLDVKLYYSSIISGHCLLHYVENKRILDILQEMKRDISNLGK